MLNKIKALSTENKLRYFNRLLIFIFLAFVPVIFSGNRYRVYFFCVVGIYAIAATGLDLLQGGSGQFSMGSIGFSAVGGYVSVLLSKNLGLPVPLTILIGALAGALVGALVAIPCAKLKFQFMSLATIAFANFMYYLICNLAFLNPFRGMSTKSIKIGSLNLTRNYNACYYVVIGLVALFVLAKHLILKSKIGRAFMACRDNTRSADGMGINVRKYKVLAFALSSFCFGFSGAFLAHFTGLIISDSFNAGLSFNYLLMVIFGGTNTLAGPLVGAVAYQLINELLADATWMRNFLFGLLVLGFIGVLPGGILQGYNGILRALANLIDRITGKAKKIEAKEENGNAES
jgi:branched-chain amino acid transport system permease protein